MNKPFTRIRVGGFCRKLSKPPTIPKSTPTSRRHLPNVSISHLRHQIVMFLSAIWEQTSIQMPRDVTGNPIRDLYGLPNTSFRIIRSPLANSATAISAVACFRKNPVLFREICPQEWAIIRRDRTRLEGNDGVLTRPVFPHKAGNWFIKNLNLAINQSAEISDATWFN